MFKVDFIIQGRYDNPEGKRERDHLSGEGSLFLDFAECKCWLSLTAQGWTETNTVTLLVGFERSF